MEKKNIWLIVLAVILSLLVISLSGYIVYDKIIFKDNNNNKEKENNNIFISKIDEKKDFVYDATYDYNVSVNSYSAHTNNSAYSHTCNVKDIVVPFINIDSEEAKRANNEIKKVFDEAIKTFKQGIEETKEDEGFVFDYVYECKYTKYIDNKLLSINLWSSTADEIDITTEYYTYNFDLETGKSLSYEEVYNLIGFNSNNINGKAEQSITSTLKEELKKFIDPNTGEGYPNETDFNTFNNESINNYKKSISNNSIKYFLDTNKKLNVIVPLSLPMESGEIDTIVVVN